MRELLAGAQPAAVLHRDGEAPLEGFAGLPGDVRRHRDVVEAEQRVVLRRRLLGEHVEAGGGEAPALQRGAQRLRVHQPAARGIDQDRPGLHAREPRRVDHAVGLRRQRDVEGDDVALRQQRVERTPLPRRVGLGRRRDVEDPRAHQGEDGREDARNGAVAHQPHRPPADLPGALQHVRRRPPARAGADAAVQVDEAAEAGDHERQGHLRHGAAIGPRHIAHRDPARGGGGEVDGVDADADLLDQPQPGGGGDVPGAEGLEDVPHRLGAGERRAQPGAVVGRDDLDGDAVFVRERREAGAEPGTGRVVPDRLHRRNRLLRWTARGTLPRRRAPINPAAAPP